MAVTRVWDADAGDWIIVGQEPAPSGVPVGTIVMWGGDSANVPTGWLLCDGTPFLAATYPALAAILGTGFGTPAPGDCQIPDMRDRFVVGAGTTYSRNSKGGAATVALSIAELALHDHPQTIHSHGMSGSVSAATTNHTHDFSHTHTSPANTGPDTALAHSHVEQGLSGRPTATTGSYNRTTTDALPDSTTGGVSTQHGHADTFAVSNSAAVDTGNRGSGTAHENRPPYIGIFYIIKAVA